jgi:hypothetical protein
LIVDGEAVREFALSITAPDDALDGLLLRELQFDPAFAFLSAIQLRPLP